MKPKIKVQMPKFESLKGISWAKELLLSFIGTTLSIVLTFGTAHFVEAKQKREAGRQTAMMVIHDMENSAEYFRMLVRDDEASFNLMSEILNRMDQLENIPNDSLFRFVNAITSPSIVLYYYDDASEKIFVSSPEAWKNIDNAAFIDAVQNFYTERRTIFTKLNTDKFFIKPISHEEYYQAIIDASGKNGTVRRSFMADLLREHIDRKDVQYYISISVRRREYFTGYSNEFMRVANKCKFLMGISDEELAAYVAQKEHSGKTIKNRQIAGSTWKVEGEPDDYSEYQFHHDHTFRWTNKQFVYNAIYTGAVEFHTALSGTWEIQGDSLVLSYLPEYEFSTDTMHIRYLPEQKDYLDRLVRSWQQSYKEMLSEHEQNGGEREAYYGAIDATHNKIELTRKQTDPNGSDYDEILYLLRLY